MDDDDDDDGDDDNNIGGRTCGPGSRATAAGCALRFDQLIDRSMASVNCQSLSECMHEACIIIII